MNISLNLDWKFCKNFNENYINNEIKNYDNVDIPHNVKSIPVNYFTDKDFEGIFTYQKTFKVKVEENKKYFIEFEGFMLQADIFLNGNKLGHYISGYLPIKIDITKFIQSKNLLTVVLDTHEDPNIPPFGNIADYFTFGGIYRDVNLIIKNEAYIDDYQIFTKNDGSVDVKYSLQNPKSLQISTIFSIFDKNDNLLMTSKTPQFKLENPTLWDLDNPYLYTLKIQILYNETSLDSINLKFGFKEAVFKVDGFYLNNKKIKLIGLNRHQVYPVIGYAAPKILQEDDVLILKNDLGVNVVRLSHYPQSKYFMEKCDEIGLLTINEVPGWQFVSKDEKWRNNFLDFISRMVDKDKNYTSLIAYGVRVDESVDDHDLYSKANQIVHQKDPSRQTLGVRNFKNSECLEDIYAYNDFSCRGDKHGLDKPNYQPKNKPLIISEHNGHMFSTKANDPQLNRESQALRHNLVINDAFSSDKYTACIGWCFADYYTHGNFGSGDHICYHGVMDINRNPKFAASIYKSQLKKEPYLKVLSNLDVGDHPENVPGIAYVATNCDYIKLFIDGKYVNTFYPNRKLFKYEPHPLVIIDDFIGEIFDEPQFSKKEKKFIIKTLNKVRNYGWDKTTKLDYLKQGLIALKRKISYEELVQMINKYVTIGKNYPLYEIKGYINDKECVSEKLGIPSSYSLNVFTNYQNVELEKDKYEIIPIKVQYIDNYGNVNTYSKSILDIEISGVGELISNRYLALEGGMQTIFVKLSKPGTTKIKISLENLIEDISISSVIK